MSTLPLWRRVMRDRQRSGPYPLGLVAVFMCFGGQCLAQNTEILGPLLFDAAQRQAITSGRSAPFVQAPASTVFALSGVVKRSGGKSTAWLNGRPVLEGEPASPGVPLVIGQGQVKINKHSLRIGETLDLTTQQRTDSLPTETVTRRPWR